MAYTKNIPWTIKDIIYVFIIVVCSTIILKEIFDYLGLKAIIETTDKQSLAVLGLYFLQTLIIFGPLAFFTFCKYRSKIKDFGFNKIVIWKGIMGVIFAYLAFLGLTFIVSVITLSIGREIPGFQSQEPILPIFGDDQFSIVIAILIIVVIAPIVEEMFFRGYILQTLNKRVNKVYGTLLTALIFAVVHFEFQSIIPIFILGLILNWLFIRFNSIWPCIMFHFLNNLVTFALILYLGEI